MRKPREFFHASWLTATLMTGLLAALAGCGSADNPGAATSSFNAKARKLHKVAQAPKSGEEDVADMVAAVSASKTGPPVELKFTLPRKPEVGQAVELAVALIPRAPDLESVSIAFHVADGLEIVDGAQTDSVEKPVVGEPLRHVVKLLPKRDGIFAVTAVVTVTAENQPVTRTFLIPVISGEGLPDTAAKPEARKGL